MSHVVTIATEVRDLEVLELSCDRLRISHPVFGKVRLFSAEHTGHAVQLAGWRYPVVFDLPQGRVYYDNYEGRWGSMTRFDEVRQAYAVEKTRIEARRAGHSVTEQALADGSVRLTVHVGGAA